MKKALKSFLLGILLLPLTLATLWCLPTALLTLQSQMYSLVLIVLGAVLYAFIELVFEKPMLTYVFGHELTHALASLATGGKIHAFKVSAKGGSVSLSKTNFFVSLAPYCIPIYTVFLLICYWFIRRSYPLESLSLFFMILVGSSLAFHVSLTLYAVRQRQPDIRRTGTFFSMVFIVLINSWFLAGLSKILFWDSFASKNFIWEVINTQGDIWVWLIDQCPNLLKSMLSLVPSS